MTPRARVWAPMVKAVTAAPASASRVVVSAGIPTSSQCQKPEGVGASGSKQVTAKLLVLSGAPDQDSCGETLPPVNPQPLKTCSSGSRVPFAMAVLDSSSAATFGSWE